MHLSTTCDGSFWRCRRLHSWSLLGFHTSSNCLWTCLRWCLNASLTAENAEMTEVRKQYLRNTFQMSNIRKERQRTHTGTKTNSNAYLTRLFFTIADSICFFKTTPRSWKPYKWKMSDTFRQRETKLREPKASPGHDVVITGWYTLQVPFIQAAHLSKSDAWSSFDDCFELNVCYYRYYVKLPMLGEGDYAAFGSILPLSCLAAGAEQRLGFCLSIRLHRGRYHTHTHTHTYSRYT